MNKLFNRLNRFDTIFNRLIVSFVVLVVVVVFFIGGFLTVQFSINYNQKVEKLERYRLEYLGNKMNALFEETNRMVREITSFGNKDKEVQKFLNYPMKDDFFKAVKLLEYLHIIDAQNDSYIENIELYVQNNDVWISTFTGINYTDENYEAFLSSLDTFELETRFQNSKRWLSKRVIKYSSREIPVYSFTAGYPLYTEERSKFKGYVIINIRQQVINDLLKDFLTREQDAVAIMNLQGDIITVQGNTGSFNAFLKSNKAIVSKILKKNENQEVYKIKGNIITSQAIGIEDWKIINLVSTKEYYDETRAIQVKIIYFSLIVIAIGLLLSYLFAKDLYKPFYLIMNKLRKAKLNKKARESEYYYIDRAIEELYDNAVVKEEALRENSNIIKRDFVVNLLSAKIYDPKDIDDKLEFLGYKERMQSNYLLVIKLHKKIYVHLDELSRNLITYNMIHFFDNYSNSTIRCLSADLFDGKISVILSTQGDGKLEVKTLRKKFVDYMKINFSVDPIITQSSMFSDLGETHKGYQDLQKILDYIYFMPHTYFIDWETCKDKLSQQREDLNPDFDMFSEALVTRNIGLVEKVLKNFIEDASKLTASVEYLDGVVLKYVFLYNHFMRDIMKDGKGEKDSQIFKDINEQYDVEDFYFWFMQLIETTFEELSRMEKNPTKTVIGLIEKIIMEHLEEDLSLEFIAEKVYLCPKYISRIFKEEKGVNITQYITDCKLKKATKLLIETNIPLEELIKQVGFSSTNYFIKKFKEKYSITPVQYRRNSIK
jgi:YesN/AraC family two-component response regulator